MDGHQLQEQPKESGMLCQMILIEGSESSEVTGLLVLSPDVGRRSEFGYVTVVDPNVDESGPQCATGETRFSAHRPLAYIDHLLNSGVGQSGEEARNV